MLIEFIIIIIAVIVVIVDFLYSSKAKQKIRSDEVKSADMSLFIKEKIEKKDTLISSADDKIAGLNKQVSLLKDELDNANKRLRSQQAHSAALEKELSELKQKLSEPRQEQALKPADKEGIKTEESPHDLPADNKENNSKDNTDSSSGADGKNYVSRDEYNKLKRELESKNKSLGKMYLSRRINNIQKSIKNKIEKIEKIDKPGEKDKPEEKDTPDSSS